MQLGSSGLARGGKPLGPLGRAASSGEPKWAAGDGGGGGVDKQRVVQVQLGAFGAVEGQSRLAAPVGKPELAG